MATTGKTTKETTANLGFEAELGNTSICGQESNATARHLAPQGMAVLANDPAVPGSSNQSGESDPFGEKMPRPVAELHGHFAESAQLEQAVKANLKRLGYAFE